MPELNLEALKKKPRTSEKYRPYDILTPSKDKAVESKSVETNKPEPKEKLVADTKVEEITAIKEETREIKLASDTSNIEKEEISSPTSLPDSKSELELKKEIEELKKQLIKTSGKDESIPSLEPTKAKFKTFKNNDKDVDNEVIFKVMKITSQWTEPERKLFMFLLEKTDFGTMDNIQLGRKEIENKAVHGSYFKDAREKLQQIGVVSYKIGYIGTTKKQGTFYSLNLRNLFS